MVIYKTTNLVNGKVYIGRDLKNNPLYIGSGKVFLRAIEKYRRENFRKEIIEQCSSVEELNEREKYWISFFNSTDKSIGYNIMEGGQGGNCGTYHRGKDHYLYGKTPAKHIREAVAKANALRPKVFGENNKTYKKIDNNLKQLILRLSSEGFGRDKIYVEITKMGIKCPARRTITRRLKEWNRV